MVATLHGGHVSRWPHRIVAVLHVFTADTPAFQDLDRVRKICNEVAQVLMSILMSVHVSIHRSIYTCMYTCLYTCLHTRLHAHLHTCPHTSKICNTSAQVLIVCNRLLLEKLPEHPPFGLNVGGHTSQGTTIEISLNRAKEVAIHMPGYMSMHMSTHMSTHMPILLSMPLSMHMSTR